MKYLPRIHNPMKVVLFMYRNSPTVCIVLRTFSNISCVPGPLSIRKTLRCWSTPRDKPKMYVDNNIHCFTHYWSTSKCTHILYSNNGRYCFCPEPCSWKAWKHFCQVSDILHRYVFESLAFFPPVCLAQSYTKVGNFISVENWTRSYFRHLNRSTWKQLPLKSHHKEPQSSNDLDFSLSCCYTTYMVYHTNVSSWAVGTGYKRHLFSSHTSADWLRALWVSHTEPAISSCREISAKTYA